jgi:hypothetical protein
MFTEENYKSIHYIINLIKNIKEMEDEEEWFDQDG